MPPRVTYDRAQKELKEVYAETIRGEKTNPQAKKRLAIQYSLSRP